jgi:hypothetical protein
VSKALMICRPSACCLQALHTSSNGLPSRHM